MERPSHFDFHTSHTVSHRMGSLVAAALLPAAVLYVLAHGMGTRIVDTIGSIQVLPFDKPVKPKDPPPLPVEMKNVPLVTAVVPTIHIETPASIAPVITPSVAPIATHNDAGAAPGPSRAPEGVLGTHTIPPYPALALRMGAEGKVMLRLSVLADGKVAKAEIVNSSGRADLDDAAQAWIVAHWLYSPALDKGKPVAGQAMATVTFVLANQH